MEIFIQAKLKFITWEHLLRKLQELFCLLQVKAQLYWGGTSNDMLLATQSRSTCKKPVVGGCDDPLQD